MARCPAAASARARTLRCGRLAGGGAWVGQPLGEGAPRVAPGVLLHDQGAHGACHRHPRRRQARPPLWLAEGSLTPCTGCKNACIFDPQRGA